MPVILTSKDEIETRMTAPPQEALRLQRPLPDDTVRIVARGERSDDIAAQELEPGTSALFRNKRVQRPQLSFTSVEAFMWSNEGVFERIRVLMIFCHPRPDSFAATLRDTAVPALTSTNHVVEISDLYEEGFDDLLLLVGPTMSLEGSAFVLRQDQSAFNASKRQRKRGE